jgi:hypothetical protein
MNSLKDVYGCYIADFKKCFQNARRQGMSGGNWMYMETQDVDGVPVDRFKHSLTRETLKFARGSFHSNLRS